VGTVAPMSGAVPGLPDNVPVLYSWFPNLLGQAQVSPVALRVPVPFISAYLAASFKSGRARTHTRTVAFFGADQPSSRQFAVP
jgi:hypothetical protein